MTIQEKYATVTQDFLERNGQFVKIRTTDRLGWEDTLPEGTAYSSLILNPKDEEELLKNAVNLARQTLAVMATRRKLNLRIGYDTSCTDGNTVYVATKVLDDGKLDLGQRLDTFLGLTVHEGSHVLYTDFQDTASITNKTVHNIWNILEDERIERRTGEDLPGLANYLRATKYYYFNLYADKTADMQENPAIRLLNTVLALVRYPASMVKDNVMEFADELLEVRRILTPYPQSTKEALEKALSIYDIVKRFVTKDKQQPQQQQNGDSDSENDSSDSESEQEQQENEQNQSCSANSSADKTQQDKESDNGTPDSDNKENKQDGTPSSGDGKDEDEMQDSDNGSEQDSDNQQDAQSGKQKKLKSRKNQNGSSSDDNAENNSSIYDYEPADEAETEELLNDLNDALEDTISKDAPQPGKNPLEKKDVCKAAKEDDNLLANELDGLLERGTLKGSIVVKKGQNRVRYEESLQRVRKHIPAIRKALVDNSHHEKMHLYGMRNGTLDTNKLPEATLGSPTVYTRTMDTPSKKITIALVIDESGSMSGKRFVLCRDAAVLITEALKDVPDTELFIYGYTNSKNYKTCLFPYIESPKDKKEKYTLGSITAMNCTPTREAIIESAARIRKHSSNKCIMLVLSDGDPDSSRWNVRQAIQGIKKDNFSVIGISIASDLTEQALREMYDLYIMMDQVQDLASELGKTVKRTILKNTR